MLEDRLEIAIAEAAGLGGQGERRLDELIPNERGEFGRPVHLRPDALGARGGGEDQPALGARAEPQEGRLGGVRRSRPRVERIGSPLGIVGRIDPRVAGRREPMAGNLTGAGLTDVGDDELVAGDADPDPLADELVGDRVARRAIADRRLLVDDAGDAEGDRVRLVGDRVEPAALVGEHLIRRPPGLAMVTSVDLGTERVAGRP